MKMKHSHKYIKDTFDGKMEYEWGQNLTKQHVEDFIGDHFEPEGSEKWTPTDWIKIPRLVNNIKDENIKIGQKE